MTTIVVSLPDDAGLAEAIGAVPDVEFVRWDLEGAPPRAQIDIVVPPYWGNAKSLSRIADVETRLVQWQSIGFNGVQKYLPAGVVFANAASVHETATAELAVGLTLAAQRGIVEFARQAPAWNPGAPLPGLADRRVLLIGYGGVGKAIEARLAPFEVELTRMARSARDEKNLAGETVHVHSLDELGELLPQADIVILGVPLTDETAGLIDAAALAALPDDALLVNVARGPVVDTAALVSELQAGRLRAALDVTDPEPLPADHPLWECPNVLITPHVGGSSAAMLPRVARLIRRQIAHLRAEERPENIVIE